MAVKDPPRTFERGTSPGRHPWYLVSEGQPPIKLPPGTTIVTGGMGDPPSEDECPGCRSLKAGVCGCGYDWDNWEWIDRTGAR
jgi:hypothetical protein